MEAITQFAPEFLLLLFLAITFLQSGLDKLLDWGGNCSWLKAHFKDTPLRNSVPLLLGVVTLMEILSGGLALGGIFQFLATGNTLLAFIAGVGSGLTLLMLLLGQRLAKDYEGARTLVVYLIPTLMLLILLRA